MAKTIKAISKVEFDSNFSDNKFNYYDYAAFISILDYDNNESKYNLSIPNFLQVKMWDIEDDIIKDGIVVYTKPSDKELERIIDFIEDHKNKQVFIIHCSAGISRSGAIARYLLHRFHNEIDSKKFYKENKFIQPNLYIFYRLKEIFKNRKYYK